MSSGFRRGRAGIEVRLDAGEAQALAYLVEDLIGLLGEPDDETPGGTDPTAQVDPLEALLGLSGRVPTRPSDPALARLLPDAYRPDAAHPEYAGAAEDFRRYTEADLRAGKLAAATAVLTSLAGRTGDRLALSPESAQEWLATLNDLRLALGTRLEVTEETDTELDRLPADDPRARLLQVYAWLGWLQETLVRAVADW